MAFEFITQPSPLKWYDSLALNYYSRYQHKHQVPYNDPVPLNQVPSFSWGRDVTGNQIVYFRLYNCETDSISDITAEIKAAGLRIEVNSDGTRENIVYPATVKILGISLTAGFYYAIMSDGLNTWYSERFNMMNPTELGQHMKISYCHGDPIKYGNNGDLLEYRDGFMNTVYYKSLIRLPSYQLQTVGDERQSIEFYSQKVAYKQYTFQIRGPEYMFDTLMAIQVHDKIEIESEGIYYRAYNFVLSDPDWDNGVGDIGTASVTFRANAIAIQSASKNSCDLTPGNCISVNYDVKAILTDGSPDYINYRYDDVNGTSQDLQDGDYILRSPDGLLGSLLTLQQYNSAGPGYTSVLALAGQIVFNEKSGAYYYYEGIATGWVLPRVTSWTDGTKTLVAESIQSVEVVNEVYAIVSGVEVFLGSFSSADLQSGVVLTDMPVQANFVIIRLASPKCGPFYDSVLYPIVVSLCNIVSIGEYGSEQLASAGGAVMGEYFDLNLANIYGMPTGIVFQYMSSDIYNDDNSARLNGLQDGQCYALALSNVFASPPGVVRILSPSVTYESDAAAGVGGVAIGDPYSLALINIYGLPANIQKIRKS